MRHGFALSTGFFDADGDRVGMYVLYEDGRHAFRVRDNGMVLPVLEASGVNRRSGSRSEALSHLMGEYGVGLDEGERTFHIEHVSEIDLPKTALRFVAFLLRVRDLQLLSEKRVANTFREDAERMLREVVGSRGEIAENEPISSALSDFAPDFVVRINGAPPVGLFFGLSDARVWEALFVKMRLRHEIHENAVVSVLLERGTSVSSKVRQQAVNRLDAVAEFVGDEVAAIHHILGPGFHATGSVVH